MRFNQVKIDTSRLAIQSDILDPIDVGRSSSVHARNTFCGTSDPVRHNSHHDGLLVGKLIVHYQS